MDDRLLTSRTACQPSRRPNSHTACEVVAGTVAPRCPPSPGGCSPSPTRSTQLEALDQDLLIRRDLERLFGVSKVRATQLMTTFGAGRTGHLLTLPRAALLRQLRRHRTAGRLPRRGDAARPGRHRAPPGPAHRDPGRGAPRGARGAPVRPARGRVGRARPDRGALPRRQGRRRAALRARPGADQRLRALRGVGRGGRGWPAAGERCGNERRRCATVARTDSARTARARGPRSCCRG